jgi:23S rRNA pseudouridine1911/1915/1917 synthase
MNEDSYLDEQDALFEHHNITVDPNQSPLRLDKYLIDKLPNVSRNRVQIGIKEEFVKVNGSPVKTNYKVRPGDNIIVSLPEPPRDTEVIPENIPLNIIFEDDNLMIVNKPAGMVVHPAYQNWTGTLVNALAYHFKNLPEMEGNEGRPGLVHRIDKDTSGLLVIAKTEPAMMGLAKQFFDHSIDRTYVAVVWGEPNESGTININLGRSLKDRRITAPFPDGDFGKRAITHYKTLEQLRYVSVVECKLETGRTHQIRAHMKYIGHPLFNDSTYGGNEIVKGTKFTKYKAFVQNCFKIISRQALHAKSLGFIHPITKEKLFFESDLPEDMMEVMVKWRNYVQHH